MPLRLSTANVTSKFPLDTRGYQHTGDSHQLGPSNAYKRFRDSFLFYTVCGSRIYYSTHGLLIATLLLTTGNVSLLFLKQGFARILHYYSSSLRFSERPSITFLTAGSTEVLPYLYFSFGHPSALSTHLSSPFVQFWKLFPSHPWFLLNIWIAV